MILSDLYQIIDDTTMVSLATEHGNMLAPMSAIRSTPDRPPVGFRTNHGSGYSGWYDVRKVNAMNRKRAWEERNAP